MSKELIIELKNKMNSRHNSNFHFDNLNWNTRVALADLCEILDERLKELAEPKPEEK